MKTVRTSTATPAQLDWVVGTLTDGDWASIQRDARIGVMPVGDTHEWAAGVCLYDIEQQLSSDPDPCTAVMRCYVREQLGATFEAPDDL